MQGDGQQVRTMTPKDLLDTAAPAHFEVNGGLSVTKSATHSTLETIRIAANMCCANIQAFIEPECAGQHLVTLRTNHSAYQFLVSAVGVCAVEHGDLSAKVELAVHTLGCCGALLRAEKALVLP